MKLLFSNESRYSYQLVEKIKLVHAILFRAKIKPWNIHTLETDLPIIFTIYNSSKIIEKITETPNQKGENLHLLYKWLSQMYVYIWENSTLRSRITYVSKTEQTIFEELEKAGGNIGLSYLGWTSSPNKSGIHNQHTEYFSDNILPPSSDLWYRDMDILLNETFKNQQGGRGHNGRRRSGRRRIQRITKRKSRRTRRCH